MKQMQQHLYTGSFLDKTHSPSGNRAFQTLCMPNGTPNYWQNRFELQKADE
jgi:hypothetical protein